MSDRQNTADVCCHVISLLAAIPGITDKLARETYRINDAFDSFPKSERFVSSGLEKILRRDDEAELMKRTKEGNFAMLGTKSF